jgi:surface antigen
LRQLELGFSVARRVLAHGLFCATGTSLKAAIVLAAGTLSAACGIMAPFERTPVSTIASDAELTTGSITPRLPKAASLPPGQVSPFSPKLDEEDWRRARAAMATALDPQGNGGQARWENTDSGHRGTFSAVGDAFIIKDEICRTYVAMVTAKEPEQWFQGTACRVSANEWLIKDHKDWKKPS